MYYATMSITAVHLTDGIRVNRATQKGSIYDVISVVTPKDNTHGTQTLARISRNKPELNPKCVNSESMARAGELR